MNAFTQPVRRSGAQKPILVTGAGGFIGRALVRHLAAEGHAVRAATRSPAGYGTNRANVETVALPDLSLSDADWEPMVAGCDAVVHLAAIAHADAPLPDETYRRVNGEAVTQLAEAAAAAGVRRVVFVSSVKAQSGPVAPVVLDEQMAPAPVDAYGRAKLAGEQGLARALEGTSTDWVTLRPVLVYGPGVKANMAALLRLARWKVPLPLGGLGGRRSVLALDNLISAVRHALFADAAAVGRRTFLVADLAPMTVPEIVSAMRLGMGRKPGQFALPGAMVRLAARVAGKSEALARLEGDLVVSTEALREAGWRPVVGTQKALAELVACLRSSPPFCSDRLSERRRHKGH